MTDRKRLLLVLQGSSSERALISGGLPSGIGFTVSVSNDEMSREPAGSDPDMIIADADQPDADLNSWFGRLGGLGLQAHVVLLTATFTASNVARLATRCDLVLPKPMEASAIVDLVDWLASRGNRVSRSIQTYKLSPRESSLVRYSLQGLNNDEIAGLLGCTRATVSTYWSRVFRKTKCSGQRQVMALVSGRHLGELPKQQGVG